MTPTTSTILLVLDPDSQVRFSIALVPVPVTAAKHVASKPQWFKTRRIMYPAHSSATWAGHSNRDPSWFHATSGGMAQLEDAF